MMKYDDESNNEEVDCRRDHRAEVDVIQRIHRIGVVRISKSAIADAEPYALGGFGGSPPGMELISGSGTRWVNASTIKLNAAPMMTAVASSTTFPAE